MDGMRHLAPLVRLLDGPFKDAQDKNLEYVMAMDPDRLLAPVGETLMTSSNANLIFPLGGAPFYGMKIEQVQQISSTVIEVETTGAIYRLEPDKLDMTRKIDPATNSINPRLVASLTFVAALQPLQILSAGSEKCVIQCDGVRFAFLSDSLFLVTNTSDHPVEYRHENLITPVPWDRQKSTEPYSRLWTDGYGGSLHALADGTVSAVSSAQTTLFELAPDSSMAHMVFPARRFDFERLYRKDARPNDISVYSMAQLSVLVDHIRDNPTFIGDNHIGTVVGAGALLLGDPRRDWLIKHADLYHYEHLWDRAALPPDEYRAPPGQPTPVASAFYATMESLHPNGDLPLTFQQYIAKSGFILLSDEEKEELKDHISIVRHHGLKFLVPAQGYLMWLPEPHQRLVIDWLLDIKNEYKLDGFYLDNGIYGNNEHGAWHETYLFFKRMRKALGEDLFIFHHNSVDVWDGRDYSGVRAIMVDTYSDATYAGEVGNLADLDEPGGSYLRCYSSGYGTTQAIAHYKRSTTRQGAFSEEEKVRVAASNLNGANRAPFVYIDSPTEDYFQRIWAPYLNFYQERKAEYLEDPSAFSPDVDWPPAWFQPVSNLQVTPLLVGGPLSVRSVAVSWDTVPVRTDYTITILNESAEYKEWWKSGTGEIYLVDTDYVGKCVPNPEQYIQTKRSSELPDYTLRLSHVVEFHGLANATYKVRIRSSNQLPGSDERIFGYAGTFNTDSIPDPVES